jgi:catalase-peroxidase
LLIDKAQLLTLTAPEMTVLVGGMRVLNANYDGSKHGVFTTRPETSDQRFLRQSARFEHDLDGDFGCRNGFRGTRPQNGELKWTATRVDLIFGSNSQLRAVAEVFAAMTPTIVLSRFCGGVDKSYESRPLDLT